MAVATRTFDLFGHPQRAMKICKVAKWKMSKPYSMYEKKLIRFKVDGACQGYRVLRFPVHFRTLPQRQSGLFG